MRSEQLKHQVTFLTPSGTTIVDGVEQPYYAPGLVVRASVVPLQGRELFQAEATYPELTTKIIIRYRQGTTSAMRVKYGTRIFELIAPPIDTNEEHKELVLLCKEVKPS